MKNTISLFLLFAGGIAYAQGMLTGSASAPAKMVDLTSEGSLDWVHWGYIHGVTMQSRKAGANVIGELRKIGTREIHTYENNPTGYTWSNGAPAAQVTKTNSGIFIYGKGFGFELTTPADTKPRRLRIYLGVWRATGNLEVTLSDGSAAPFTAKVEPDPSVEMTNVIYTLDYKAKSPGQKLLIRFTNAAGGGNMELQSATLSSL